MIEIDKFISTQSRLKSRVLWVALFSIIAFAIKYKFKIVIPIPILDNLVDIALILAGGYGVGNNPKDANNY